FAAAVTGGRAAYLAATARPAAPLARTVASPGVPRDRSRRPLVQGLFNSSHSGPAPLASTAVGAGPSPGRPAGRPLDRTVSRRGRRAVAGAAPPRPVRPDRAPAGAGRHPGAGTALQPGPVRRRSDHPVRRRPGGAVDRAGRRPGPAGGQTDRDVPY